MNEKRVMLSEAGERAFINLIRSCMPQDGGQTVRSAGDDCLVIETPPYPLSMTTTDTFVDSVHFTPAYSTYYDIGCRCMAASISDIAAMAGTPGYTVVSLSMPSDMFLDDAISLFKGLAETADGYGCPILGGETTATPGPLTVTVTVTGYGDRGGIILRNGAHPGDAIYVTGMIGDAMAGLRAFQDGLNGYDRLKQMFLRPTAQVDTARELAGMYNITAMIDLSDGIDTDLGHICEESHTGALIDIGALPLSSELQLLADELDFDAAEFALMSGEDFGLLITSDDKRLDGINHINDMRITRIGMITTPGDGIRLRFTDGSITPLTGKGYEHFIS